MESPAIQSESLVCDSKVCWYLSRKRVELLGSVIWNGDSTHQSLNTMGKLIAKKYREGKIKSTLKKEWKQTWNDIVGTDYSFNWLRRMQISVAFNSCLDISSKEDGVSQKCIWKGSKGTRIAINSWMSFSGISQTPDGKFQCLRYTLNMKETTAIW